MKLRFHKYFSGVKFKKLHVTIVAMSQGFKSRSPATTCTHLRYMCVIRCHFKEDKLGDAFNQLSHIDTMDVALNYLKSFDVDNSLVYFSLRFGFVASIF